MSGNEAPQAFLERHAVEVDEQADLAAAEAKVGERLCFMHWQDAIDRLELEQHPLIDNDVGKVALVEADVLVDVRSDTVPAYPAALAAPEREGRAGRANDPGRILGTTNLRAAEVGA